MKKNFRIVSVNEKFSAMMIFSALWTLLVYFPICHMTWAGPGALFAEWGGMDFAGGVVVHVNAGVAALVACIVLGPRKGYPTTPMPPHNLTMTVTGTGMLRVGWFGFNAGSALAADGSAGMAMLVTPISAAAATLTWMAIEWVKHGKPSVLGAVTMVYSGVLAYLILKLADKLVGLRVREEEEMQGLDIVQHEEEGNILF